MAQIPAGLARACPDIRAAGPADAVAGCQPSLVAAPASTQEASALLAAASGLGLAMVPRGAGTRLHWGAAPARCDLIVDTRRLNAVLEHAAGDLVARVQAGVALADLAEVLAQAGQRLALDPPPGGTAGGLIATGVAGPLRLRYGPPRDLLIGVTVVLADGTVAHSGGKVVKNVAGYDLGKLFAGSYGTLGLVTEAAFRLHPVPQASAWVTVPCADTAAAQEVMATAAASVLAPSAAEIDWPGRDAPVRAGILVEGDKDGAAERAEQLRGLLDGASLTASAGQAEVAGQPPAWWGRGAAAAEDGTVLRVAFWAGRLAAVLETISAAAAAAGLDPAVSGSAAAGVLHVALGEDAAPAAVADFVRDVRASVSRAAQLAPAGTAGGRAGPGEPARPGGSVVVLHAPGAVAEKADLWGPVPAIELMRAVKDQFDPGHLMAPGRFAGGI
jgi:glycolate oxidase FAD binding subunit